jgi:hypothetical protein
MFHLDYTSKDPKQQGHVQFKIHGPVWHTLVFCFTPSLLHEKKKREKGRQAPEPPPEKRGTRKSMMKQNPFPEKRKKREEGRQAPEPSRNQEEPVNHDGTEALS